MAQAQIKKFVTITILYLGPILSIEYVNDYNTSQTIIHRFTKYKRSHHVVENPSNRQIIVCHQLSSANLTNFLFYLLAGIGFGICVIASYVAMYYNTIIAWSLYFLFSTFKVSWNDCVDIYV